MESYGMTMTLEDEVYEKMGRDFTKHLAQSMSNTRLQLMSNLFEEEYRKWSDSLVQLVYVRRGRYEVWKGNKRLAKNIKHRKEALALIKLIRGNQE